MTKSTTSTVTRRGGHTLRTSFTRLIGSASARRDPTVTAARSSPTTITATPRRGGACYDASNDRVYDCHDMTETPLGFYDNMATPEHPLVLFESSRTDSTTPVHFKLWVSQEGTVTSVTTGATTFVPAPMSLPASAWRRQWTPLLSSLGRRVFDPNGHPLSIPWIEDGRPIAPDSGTSTVWLYSSSGSRQRLWSRGNHGGTLGGLGADVTRLRRLLQPFFHPHW